MAFDDTLGNLIVLLLAIFLCGLASYFGTTIALKRWAANKEKSSLDTDLGSHQK